MIIFGNVQELFSIFAQMTSSIVKKYIWNETSGGYEETAGEYPAQSSGLRCAELDTKFSTRMLTYLLTW